MLFDQLQRGIIDMATALAETEALALVEEIRDEIRALDYEPLDEAALAEVHAATEHAHDEAESEGVLRSARTAALFEMLIQERAPEDVRDLAVERFMEALARVAHSAAGDEALARTAS